MIAYRITCTSTVKGVQCALEIPVLMLDDVSTSPPFKGKNCKLPLGQSRPQGPSLLSLLQVYPSRVV